MRDDPFFKDTPRNILDMAGEPLEFPILYYDFRTVMATFTAKTSGLKRLLPHDNFRPIEIRPGRGMLGIIALEYCDTSIGPYNEIAIIIPCKFPPKFAFPGFSAISMMLKKIFPVYIHHLPVTTEIALKAGIHFWNYPKFLAEITFQDYDRALEVTLREENNLILRILAQKLPLKKSGPIETHTYSVKEGTVMHTLIDMQAPRHGTAMMGSCAELELGEHPISKELVDLQLSRSPRSGIYGEGMMGKLYAPDKFWKADTLDIVSSETP